jgi:hypothetical protein
VTGPGLHPDVSDILEQLSHEITSVGPSWQATLYWSPGDASGS